MSKYYKKEEMQKFLVDVISFKIWDYDEEINRDTVIKKLYEIPTIEVSEDCISREYLKSFEYINKGDFNSVETIREWIDNAPSVVPKQSELTEAYTRGYKDGAEQGRE